ncbi:GntR family transcriptional regulator [Roseomonas sp. KE2513]|uniref:GntR family transcriptional regulator n=1 Tax=Roseomonas sp. KE2513 TaxID=2479202 RepID=UPI0018DF683A|nr:GntR family transcriptional regulator [Roseomonas sp. KE2513]MBI0538596.1 GntR family transcriptional regulator [Roseomonas sp. KE2513]
MADGAYARLHEMLLTHRLPLDAPVSERSLAAELGISRTPLREAFRRLEGEGLLERLPGGVLRVRRITVEEFLEIQQLRRLLEGEAAAQAAGRVGLGLLHGLRARIASLLASSHPTSSQQRDRLAIDLELHRAIAAAAANATLARLLEDLRRRMLLFATPPPAERLEDVCAQYGAIIDALVEADPEAARSAMTRHVDALRTGILRRLAAL